MSESGVYRDLNGAIERYRNERIAQLGSRRLSREDQIIEQRWREEIQALQVEIENLVQGIGQVDSEAKKAEMRERLAKARQRHAEAVSLYKRRF